MALGGRKAPKFCEFMKKKKKKEKKEEEEEMMGK